jgi:hypothetical protein
MFLQPPGFQDQTNERKHTKTHNDTENTFQPLVRQRSPIEIRPIDTIHIVEGQNDKVKIESEDTNVLPDPIRLK